MTLEDHRYIKQLEEENSALKKKLEDRKEVDAFDEIEMRKLWLHVVKEYSKKMAHPHNPSIADPTPSMLEKIAHMIVESYKKEFNIK